MEFMDEFKGDSRIRDVLTHRWKKSLTFFRVLKQDPMILERDSEFLDLGMVKVKKMAKFHTYSIMFTASMSFRP